MIPLIIFSFFFSCCYFNHYSRVFKASRAADSAEGGVTLVLFLNTLSFFVCSHAETSKAVTEDLKWKSNVSGLSLFQSPQLQNSTVCPFFFFSLHLCLNSGFCWWQLILNCQNQNAPFFVRPLLRLRALCCGEPSSHSAFFFFLTNSGS